MLRLFARACSLRDSCPRVLLAKKDSQLASAISMPAIFARTSLRESCLRDIRARQWSLTRKYQAVQRYSCPRFSRARTIASRFGEIRACDLACAKLGTTRFALILRLRVRCSPGFILSRVERLRTNGVGRCGVEACDYRFLGSSVGFTNVVPVGPTAVHSATTGSSRVSAKWFMPAGSV